MAVLRDVAHAHGAPLADGGVGDVLPAEEKLAGHQRFQTGQAIDPFRLAVAVGYLFQSREALNDL